MNTSVIVMVVVGVLFVAGSVDAVRLTVDDVRGAIEYAWKMYMQLDSTKRIDGMEIKSTTYGVTLSDKKTVLTVDCTVDGIFF